MICPEVTFPDFIPEGCRACPSLVDDVKMWQVLQHRQDISMKVLTDDDFSNDAASRIISVNLGGDSDDQGIASSPESLHAIKVEAIREVESLTYQKVAEVIDDLEESMKARVAACTDKKPTTASVPHKNGAVLIKICGATMENICAHKEHSTSITIRRRK